VTDPDLTGVRLAVVNWRDPWHPQAGGAEKYAWEMATRLRGRGAEVSYLTARAQGQARRERRDGIAVVRLGGRFTVYPLVLGWMLSHRWSFDAVLDCQNGIPFFTPAVLPRRVPVFCVVHHVHTEQFGVHFPAWAARIGRILEGPVARLVYRRHASVAVSPSTIDAMRQRLRWPTPIHLIPNGVDYVPPVPGAQGDTGGRAGPPCAEGVWGGSFPPRQQRLCWVGRLVVHKRAELVLPVAERLRDSGVVIDVVGRGPAERSLEEAINAAGLADAVRMRGFLPEEEKQSVVAGSVLHLNTSRGEGWGLCVLEAAALGVPTVAFDVEGLRDAVRDGQTGWLVADGEQLADVVEGALKELADPRRRSAIATACREWAAQYNWDASATRMAELIREAVRCD
jgi:glycosyltransferase involved in cell wall biosynthesis